MPQIHFSVDEQTAKRIAREAKKRGMTVSKYVATLVAHEMADAWPPSYLDTVVGSCGGAQLTEPEELTLDDVEIAPR
jgi:hypothetical protein